MDRWSGRVALVTGGNSGIGAAITRCLLEHGMIVVAVDCYADYLHDLAVRFPKLQPVVCDVSSEEDVLSTFSWAEDKFGGIDVLVNNAGISGGKSLLDGNPVEWRHILNVNVVALCLCTREAIRSMRSRSVDDGHVINISSHVSFFVPQIATFHMYSATKHAVRAVTEGFRQELRTRSSGIKVTAISPGLVKSDFLLTALGKRSYREMYQTSPYLLPADIAGAVQYILEQPPHVQVHDILIKPQGSQQ
ncbi:dehydrogenase/reductase SDR family member 11 [Anabrus simplex]|uniref:dehydrogenase/reductase SDR family member 11 n=1 Tax=Anabrus simplex TaxID=316456 RepID=UPI0035A2D7CC